MIQINQEDLKNQCSKCLRVDKTKYWKGLLKLNVITQNLQRESDSLLGMIPQIQNHIDVQNYQKQLNTVQLQTCFGFQEWFNQLMERIQLFTEYFINITKEINELHPHNNICEQNWNIKSQKSQQELCCCLAFNKSGSTLATGAGHNIKLWKFSQGQLIDNPQTLFGHEQPVTCLAFSMKQEKFISGSEDCSIRIWKKQQISLWIPKNYIKQNYAMLGVLFDDNTDQVISWSKEKVIRISQITNQDLEEIQILKKHDDNIDCVCLNETQTVMCSSGCNYQLIIWKKNQNLQWEFSYIINKTRQDYICRMAFLQRNLLCVNWNEGIVSVFQQQDGIYQENSKLQINLNKECDGENLFPCIFNKQKGILILKHNKFIYTVNDHLIQCAPPIDCGDIYCYGTLTTDGQYLAVWDDSSKKISIYQFSLQ